MMDIAHPLVVVEEVYKSFGAVEVLQGLSLDVPRQQTLALIGHNGSGKTTLIKILLGLARADQGRLFFDGHKVAGGWHYRERIGYMPQIARFPDNLTGRELLRFVDDLRGHPPSLDTDLVQAFKLEPELDKPLRTLSGGTRQKVNAALTFRYRPDLYILDEPTASLDPVAAGILKDKIRAEQAEGRTVLLTSHILSEVERLAHRVAFLLNGRVYTAASVEALKQQTGQATLEQAIAHLMEEAAA